MSEKSTSTERIEKQLREMGPEYLKRREVELQEFQSLTVDLNLERLETLGHRMKGTAKSYGYESLGILGGNLEAAAHNEDTQAARLILNQILNFISSFKSQHHAHE